MRSYPNREPGGRMISSLAEIYTLPGSLKSNLVISTAPYYGKHHC